MERLKILQKYLIVSKLSIKLSVQNDFLNIFYGSLKIAYGCFNIFSEQIAWPLLFPFEK